MNGGFAKLFTSIVTSSVWSESNETRITWITLLAIADGGGRVEASIPGLAHLARISVPDCEEALKRLAAPDSYSRTTDYQGRRIEAIDGGWAILNYAKYRERRDPEKRRAQNRNAKRRQRERQAEQSPVSQMSANVSQNQPESAQAEAEASNRDNTILGGGVGGGHSPCPALPEDSPAFDCPAIALPEPTWPNVCDALDRAFPGNATIQRFRKWLASKLVRKPAADVTAACQLALELVVKAHTDGREPVKWFVGAVKKSPSEGGFGYRPTGRRSRRTAMAAGVRHG